LSLPYSKLPPKIKIFEISGGRVFAVLDPRAEGFINRGHEFGDVREFLSPRGALSEVASIDDPLRLELQPGSRGSLRIYGYEVIFKYEKPLPPKRELNMEGAGRGFFERAEVDSLIEARALWISLAAVFLGVLPFSIWLAFGRAEQISSLTTLPQEFLARIVDPDHLRLLPRVLEGSKQTQNFREEDLVTLMSERDGEKDPRSEFRKDIMISQAAYVVKELQKRWRHAEDGVSVPSSIELFRFPSPVRAFSGVAERWQVVSANRYSGLQKKRQDPSNDRYWRYQMETPRLAAVTTGDRRGSLRVRVDRRLEGIRQLRSSLYSLVKTEQDFVHEYYKGNVSFRSRKDVDLGPVFWMPSPAIFNAKPEPLFHWEIQRYQAAEAMANWSMELPGRLRFAESPRLRVGNIWLVSDGLVVPTFAGARLDGESGAEEILLKNSRYSLAQDELPPPPPEPPRIDTQGVRFSILNHKEEIASCYEAVLRRNPKASGHLTMRWQIDGGGRAQGPSVVSGTLRDKELEVCLAARLLQWRFPRPTGGTVSFEYPFKFLSQSR
jgi:hypothetical protein